MPIINIKTLGGKSSFDYDDINQTIKISSGKTYNIPIQLVSDVCNRMKSLNDTQKTMTSNYTDPKWNEYPNRILSPYIAQLILTKKLICQGSAFSNLNEEYLK